LQGSTPAKQQEGEGEGRASVPGYAGTREVAQWSKAVKKEALPAAMEFNGNGN